MIDAGRFNSAREHMDDLTPAHLPAEEDAALAAVTESVVSAPDIGTSTMFDLCPIDVSWDADAATMWARSEEHTSELQSLMRLSYAVICLTVKSTTSGLASDHTIVGI